MNENKIDESRSLDDEMFDALGGRDQWEEDAKGEVWFYPNAYRRFLENGCRGILTYEEAVEEYKIYSGDDPALVTSWPQFDWLKQKRENCAASEEIINALGLTLDEYRSMYLPYEAFLKYAY